MNKSIYSMLSDARIKYNRECDALSRKEKKDIMNRLNYDEYSLKSIIRKTLDIKYNYRFSIF